MESAAIILFQLGLLFLCGLKGDMGVYRLDVEYKSEFESHVVTMVYDVSDNAECFIDLY